MKYDELVKALRICGKGSCVDCDRQRQDKCLKRHWNNEDLIDGMLCEAAAAIEELQAQLPKRGEWIWIQKANGGQYKGCSVCHAPIPTDSMLDYLDDEDCDFCYSCGAKMEVQDESQNNRANRE